MSVGASLFLVSVRMGARLPSTSDGAPLHHRVKDFDKRPTGFHILRNLDPWVGNA